MRRKLRSSKRSSTILKYSEKTTKKEVANLKVELKKAQEAARVAKEAAKASVQVSYNLRVGETEIHLAEELAEVFKDYCPEVWAEALNLARVPTT